MKFRIPLFTEKIMLGNFFALFRAAALEDEQRARASGKRVSGDRRRHPAKSRTAIKASRKASHNTRGGR